ncbi:MAG: CYTH domain-containing protein [Clostridiales bacterium]|nr:CYTH domain-containing protein [Clostridiales bacterium]
METEVKLGFKDKESLYKVALSENFRKLCPDNSGIREPVLLENTYLDTDDLAITSRGGAIRIRHYKGASEDSYEFTVKYGGGTSKGLHRRFEWNVKSNSGEFSIESFRIAATGGNDPYDLLNEVFKDITDDDLKIACFNSFNRTVYELRYNNSTIEACFDSGVIRNSDGTKSDEICELELELIKGDINDLDEVTSILTDGNDCAPLDMTKYIRTLNMALGDRKGESNEE